ncbi:MAG: hypothetical protein KDE01_07450, partial [Caldilineaceae bacterium]|nr:hypothetical protein [Caldilineaceae bacterium]
HRPVLQWHLTDCCPACSLGTLKDLSPGTIEDPTNQSATMTLIGARNDQLPAVLSAVLPASDRLKLAGAMASCCEPLP